VRRRIDLRGPDNQNNFSPVPEIVHQKVLAALKEAKEMKHAKHHFSAGIIIAALVTLLLSGAAVATNQWGVLDYLFGGARNAGEEAMKKVWPVGQTQTALGVTATLDSVLYDGKNIAVGWVLENANPEEPVYFILDPPVADKKAITFTSNDGLENTWLPDPFMLHIHPDSVLKGGFTGVINGGEPKGAFEVCIRISVFKPAQPIYIMKDEDFLDKWGQVDYSRMNPAIWEKCMQGYLVVNEMGDVQLTLPEYEKTGEVCLGGSADEVESMGKFKREDMVFTFSLSNMDD
jgi:hypothetical protein